jgi:hypothetical protein
MARAHLGDVRCPEALSAFDTALAIAACGRGCDHLDGERLVAVIDEAPRRGVFVGALLTDRRYAWRNLSGRGSVAWADIESVSSRQGVLVAEQHLVLHDGSSVRIPALRADLTPLFEALAASPWSERCPQLRPLTMPPPEGEAHACHDPRHRMMYALVWSMHAHDGDSPISRDLCERVSLLHRTSHQGRGGRDGWWLSPLAPIDLLHALDSMLSPTAKHGIDAGHRWAEYDLPADWCRDAAIEAPAMVRRTMAAAGQGRDVTRVRITMQPAPAGAAFVVQGLESAVRRDAQPDGSLLSLSQQNPRLLARVLLALLEVERRALLRRILGGWRLPMPALLDESVGQLTASLALDVSPTQMAEIGLS